MKQPEITYGCTAADYSEKCYGSKVVFFINIKIPDLKALTVKCACKRIAVAADRTKIFVVIAHFRIFNIVTQNNIGQQIKRFFICRTRAVNNHGKVIQFFRIADHQLVTVIHIFLCGYSVEIKTFPTLYSEIRQRNSEWCGIPCILNILFIFRQGGDRITAVIQLIKKLTFGCSDTLFQTIMILRTVCCRNIREKERKQTIESAAWYHAAKDEYCQEYGICFEYKRFFLHNIPLLPINHPYSTTEVYSFSTKQKLC